MGLGVSDRQEVARTGPGAAVGHDLSRRRRGGRHLARRNQTAAGPACSGWARTRTSGRPTPPAKGPDGVCGPCSEIYYHTPFGQVEIWNLVFTQFNRVGDPPDNLRPLPSKNIDTGMGLERTAAVLQGVESNFHIDILRPLVEAAGEVCGVRYDPADENGRRLRRIADHVRACTFAVHENVYPGNKKQGYVIRRLLRRAVLDGHQMGVREPFLHKLVGRVAELMKQPYPELGETVASVADVIEKEEANFLATHRRRAGAHRAHFRRR